VATGGSSHLTVVETMPAKLTYTSGSIKMRLNGGAWLGPSAGYDLTIIGSDLEWSELTMGVRVDYFLKTLYN
jgi:hypothetical protein